MEVETNNILSNATTTITKRNLSEIAADILSHKQKEGESILAIGQLLIEAKEQIKHGAWGSWLMENVNYSEKSAQSYMKLAKAYSSNPKPVADLGATKAYLLLGLSESEREKFLAESHNVNGIVKNVLDMSKRELENVIQKRKTRIMKSINEFKKINMPINAFNELFHNMSEDKIISEIIEAVNYCRYTKPIKSENQLLSYRPISKRILKKIRTARQTAAK